MESEPNVISCRIKDAMKDRQSKMQYKRQDTIENLSIEVASIGIFDALFSKEIQKVVDRIVEKSVIDTDYNVLKDREIKELMEQKSKGTKRKASSNQGIATIIRYKRTGIKAEKSIRMNCYWPKDI